MELTALHRAVRSLVREGRVDAEAMRQLSASERRAVESLRRRLEKAGGKLSEILPSSGAAEWMAPQRQTQAS